MAYTTINKSTDYFNTKLYTGTGSSNAITGVGFQPDWVWIKQRNETRAHSIFDVVRGVQKQLKSSDTDAQSTASSFLTAFGSDGFTYGGSDNGNKNGGSYVSWNWKAGGTGSANTSGSINSTVSVNTTAGFSIVKYTGTGSAGTVGHGLGVAPKLIIVKCLDTAKAWTVYHSALGSSAAIFLEQTSAPTTSNTTYFNGTDPTSSVFSIGSSTNVTNSGDEFIAYCFAEKTGYSKFGSYTGNGNADGTFIYTGFKPEFVIFKKTNTTGNWAFIDSTRSYHNVGNHTLATNLTSAESAFGGGESVDGASNRVDLVSNGIKIRDGSAYNNTNSGSYIYIAFGQSLVGSNNIPCTAR